MRKFTAIVLSIAMVLTAVTLPTLVFADEDVSQPKITIVGSTISGSDDFFELTLRVNSNGVGFSSVGAVLQYDTSVIVPVAWDDSGTVIPLGSASDWQNVAAVPTVADTRVSGKTALTYKDSETNAGYLYLAGEMPLPDCTATPVVQPTDPEATEIPDSNIVRAVTVRFKYVGTGADDDAIAAAKAENKKKVIDGFTEGTDIVTLAPDEVAADSPAGQSVVYSADDSVTKEFYYTKDAETTVGLTSGTLLTAAPTYELELDTESANAGGGADPANFAPLVFFDWDESTLLGSMVVDSSAPEKDINEYLNSFALTKLPSEHFNLTDMCDYDLTTVTDYNAAYNNTTVVTTDSDKAAYPLAAKDGYTFFKWVDFDSDSFTICGKAVKVSANIDWETIPEPANPSYDKIASGLVLKAVYLANAKIDPETVLTGQLSRHYTVSISTDPNSGCFTRFNDSNFAVRVSVARLNGDHPVQRARTTAVRATVTLADGSSYFSLINLDNIDTQTAELAVSSSATSVRFNVIDIGGVDNWATGAANRSANFDVSGSDIELYSFINYINEASATGAAAPAAAAFTKAGLKLSGVSSTVRNRACTNIKAAQDLKGEVYGEDNRYLTKAELQYAIDNSGAWPAS